MHLHKVKTEQDASDLLGRILAEQSQKAIQANGVFRLGVSGELNTQTI